MASGVSACFFLLALALETSEAQFPGAAFYEDTGVVTPRRIGESVRKLPDKTAGGLPVNLPFVYWPSKDCELFFLDLGGNRGDSIDRWFKGYFNRLVLKRAEPSRKVISSPEEYCVLSFEGNPRWTQALQEVRRRQNSLGNRVFIFPETVVHTDYTSKTMYIDGLATNSISSSLYGSKRIGLESKRDKQKLTEVKGNRELLKTRVTVKSVLFSDLLFHLKTYHLGKSIVVKMDVEGAEYEIIRQALITGTLCYIDVLFIEWHQDVRAATSVPDNFEGVIQSIVRAPPCNMTVILAD